MRTKQASTPVQIKCSISRTISVIPILIMVMIVFCILLLSQTVKSQTLVTLENKDMPLTAMSRVVKPVEESISIANQPDTTLTMNENIRKDSITLFSNSEAEANTMVASYFQGVDDADSHYKAKKSGKGLVLATTLLGSPILGIIPTLTCSSVTPKKKNLEVPDTKLVNNEQYMHGYKDEARYIKKDNNMVSYVLGTVVWVCVAYFVR